LDIHIFYIFNYFEDYYFKKILTRLSLVIIVIISLSILDTPGLVRQIEICLLLDQEQKVGISKLILIDNTLISHKVVKYTHLFNPFKCNVEYTSNGGDVTCGGCSASYRQNR